MSGMTMKMKELGMLAESPAMRYRLVRLTSTSTIAVALAATVIR
jgi:hypothetical protein